MNQKSDFHISVSVIIVNWNSGKLLAECLRRLELQTVLPAEIWVVDNASTDGSGMLVKCSDRVRFLQMDQNIGFAAGNNRGLARCRGDYVALLNPDAFAEPDWLAQLLEAARKFPSAAAFGSRQLCYEDSDILDGTGDKYHLSGLVWRRRHGMRQQPSDLIPGEIFSPCAAAAMYRRDALLQIGGFDEDYFCYVEDVDLGFRLRLAGYDAVYVPAAVVHHVGSATTGGQRSDFSVYHGHRNLVWTYLKNMPGVLFWFLLPLHLLLNIISLGLFAARGQFRVILQAKIDAAKALARVFGKRREIQGKRIAGVRTIWKALDKNLLRDKK